MKTLDKKEDFLKSRGWTVDDRNMGINQGNGREGWKTAMAPAPNIKGGKADTGGGKGKVVSRLQKVKQLLQTAIFHY